MAALHLKQLLQQQCSKPVLASFPIASLMIVLLFTPAVAICRIVPASPLSGMQAIRSAELTKAAPAAAEPTFFAAPATTKLKGPWKPRSMRLSMTGKEPTGRAIPLGSSHTSSPKVTSGRSDKHLHRVTSSEALVDEARQVPGGPDPLHHSNQPSSP